MLVILDRQHRGRARKPNDSGAVYGPLVEADLVEQYISFAMLELTALGHSCMQLMTGEYSERHVQAINLAKGHGGRTLYLACHVNAGGGRYALVEYDIRSGKGKAFASLLAREFPRHLNEASLGKTVALSTGERGHICIAGIYSGPADMCGVIVEPGFIDSVTHAPLWAPDGLQRIGKAIAHACDIWAKA